MERMGLKNCYSHFGEDQVLLFMLRNIATGYYADVGCYHPSLYSNSMVFYEKNWNGLLVDANPFMTDLCKAERPRDVTVQCAVAGECGKTEFFKFNDWGSSNTIDPTFRDIISRGQNVEVTQTIEVEKLTLEALFDRHVPPGTRIDLLNIDIEAIDYAALQGNDWRRFRPRVIAIEDLEFDFNKPEESLIHRFLTEMRYSLYSRSVYTSIYFSNDERGCLGI